MTRSLIKPFQTLVARRHALRAATAGRVIQRLTFWKVPALCGLAFLAVVVCLVASDPGIGDWPMWGGTADRNMVSSMKGIPTSWDVKTKKNVKWGAELGSQSYGNTVVAGGQVYAGTNNELARNPKEGG